MTVTPTRSTNVSLVPLKEGQCKAAGYGLRVMGVMRSDIKPLRIGKHTHSLDFDNKAVI